MEFIPTQIPEVVIVQSEVHRDARGFFAETYRTETFREAGINTLFVQDNHSHSIRGSLRGLHGQVRSPQGKLVGVVKGTVFDVAVDIRAGSPTFGRWVGIRLSEENHRQLYIPRGFLHGFCVLSESADFQYKCDNYYDPDDQLRIRWDDPQIGIEWPVDTPLLSEADQKAPCLEEIDKSILPVYE